MKTANNKVLPLALTLAALALNLSGIQQAGAASFVKTGSLNIGRAGHTATLLPNGKVLVAGGYNGGSALASAELYDPATKTWTLTEALHTDRSAHTATLLANGKVLVAGGGDALYAELYDPATGVWVRTGSMLTAYTGHTATLLPNGDVLVAGGRWGPESATAELYHPTTGKWTDTGPLNDGRRNYPGLHTATLLPDRNVLVTGGGGGLNGDFTLFSAELYDPITGTWTDAAPLSEPRQGHSATLLPNGNVLVAGGYDRINGFQSSSTAELYDPLSGTWGATGPLNDARWGHIATLLTNGNVLVAGGLGNQLPGVDFPLSSAELYDPASGTWTRTAALSVDREFHTATLLPNGKVLVAGGTSGFSTNTLSSAELYEPDSAGPAPSLTILLNADGTLSLSWRGTGALEQTESLTAPNWQPAPSQANPQTISATGAMKFFRVKAE